MGDAGRLAKELTIGVIGVLDGLSIGTVNVLNAADDDPGESPLR